MKNGERLGATCLGDGACRFEIWAPNATKVEVLLGDPVTQSLALTPMDRGYHLGTVSGVSPGARYRFRLDDGLERPDPASRWQPHGVHGASAVYDATYSWTDGGWRGLPLKHYVIYELHVGAFTLEGTFAGVEDHLASLRALGITAVEIMPVAQFPGRRNWGYDGVYPFAVQNSYGGPAALKHLVNAAHAEGLAVVLDVVYNHLGPEGNYLRDFGPYFTTRYQTPWGSALNFDGAHSDEVRRFFIENALQWVDEFHVDALRLDAIHAIVDNSANPFVRELADAVHDRARLLDRAIHVIAETDANDYRVCRPSELGGLGCDGQWSDDLHHALHGLLTSERAGYYADFGTLDQAAVGLRDGYVFQGQYSSFRHRRHGSSSGSLIPEQFIVCAQNHDQVGNRMMGDRLASLVSFETTKLIAGVIILSPFVPLLFMGEEYGETAPFQYFVEHSDAALIEAVRRGRRAEFAAFAWQGAAPDPQDPQTFSRSRLDHSLAASGRHLILREFHGELLRLRSVIPALTVPEGFGHTVTPIPGTSVVVMTRTKQGDCALVYLNFGEEESSIQPRESHVNAELLLNSADPRWGGPGSLDSTTEASGTLRLAPRSLAVFRCGGAC